MRGFLQSKGFMSSAKGFQQGKGFLHPVKGFQLWALLNQWTQQNSQLSEISYTRLINGYSGGNSNYLIGIDDTYMWFNSNTALYRCTIGTFKANLAPVDYETETRYEFDLLTNCTQIQTSINLASIKKTASGWIGRVNAVGDIISKLYYWNGTVFVESTIPSGGHQGYLNVNWNFDVVGNRIISLGYYGDYDKGRVLYSNDGGINFKTILDVETSSVMPILATSNVHIHGGHIDRGANYQPRVWIHIGDYDYNPATNYQTLYCDNPDDDVPVWTPLMIDIDKTLLNREQYVSSFSSDNFVLFGTDMAITGVTRMARNINQRKLTLDLGTGFTYVPGNWVKQNTKSPILFYNQPAVTGVPSQIYGTFDGIKFVKLYEDTVTQAAFSNRLSPFAHVGNDVFMFQNEGLSNLRFVNSAGCVLWGKLDKSYDSFWVSQMPSDLSLSLISGGVKIDWTDHTGGMATTEVWGKINGSGYALLYTVTKGIITKNDLFSGVEIKYYKIRQLKDGVYSPFTESVSIVVGTLGAEMVNQSLWYTAGYWNTFQANWAAGDAALDSNGTGATVKTNFWSTAKRYKVTYSCIRVSGSLYGPYDAANIGRISYISETRTYYYTPNSTSMFLNGNTFVGKVTALSIKEVLTV